MLITYNHFDNHVDNHFDNHFDNSAEDDCIMHLFSRYTVLNYYNVHNHLTITLTTVPKTIIYSVDIPCPIITIYECQMVVKLVIF